MAMMHRADGAEPWLVLPVPQRPHAAIRLVADRRGSPLGPRRRLAKKRVPHAELLAACRGVTCPNRGTATCDAPCRRQRSPAAAGATLREQPCQHDGIIHECDLHYLRDLVDDLRFVDLLEILAIENAWPRRFHAYQLPCPDGHWLTVLPLDHDSVVASDLESSASPHSKKVWR